jgi:gluconolactonase
MRSMLVLLLVLLLVLGLVLENDFVLAGDDDYQPGPDSLAQANIPKGELIKGTYTAKEGSLFPGTERDYTIYLPPSTSSGPSGTPRSGDTLVPDSKARDMSVPAPCPFMVFQDGVIYNAPVVFDNLIAKKQIPPLIGIFIKPGVVPAANPNALPRYNRSYEYDSVSDTYSRFLIDEFLPAIEAKHGIKLSTDPNDAAISGISSGGICAFMTAWHRPDRFRRVFSGVGTYVGIHGADQLPVLVRKYEPKPLRIYLQSGEHDNDLYCGDWWMANQTMERALKWAGYDVNHTWGTGGHNSKHATAIFPDVLRWLWRDFSTAKEIKPNPRGDSKWLGYSVLGDGKWESCWNRSDGQNLGAPHHLAARLDGTVFASIPSSRVLDTTRHRHVKHGEHWFWRRTGSGIDPGSSPGGFVQISPGERGKLLRQSKYDYGFYGVCASEHSLIVWSQATEKETGLYSVREGQTFDGSWEWRSLSKEPEFSASSLCLSKLGRLYVATNPERDATHSILTFHFPDLAPMDDGITPIDIPGLSRIALSPDQTQLYATSSESRFVYTCKVTDRGTLHPCQPCCHLEIDDDGSAEAEGLCVDTSGWLYVATALGIQVCDQAGRVNFIIPTPQQPHDVCFGGKDLGELFIACGDKIYKRPTKAHGIVSGQMAPIKPPPPKL